MTITLATPGIRMFGMHDFRRSYVLPDEVRSNVPHRGAVGEPGAWNGARGLLVEISRRLRAEPIAVHHRELEAGPARLPVGRENTAVVHTPTGRRVTVVSHCEYAPYGPRGDIWELTVDGIVPDGGHDRYPPSLPWQALLVGLHLA